MSAISQVQNIINDNGVVVFSKTYCAYSKATKALLNSKHARYLVVELDEIHNGVEFQEALRDITGLRNLPLIFIGHRLIGGNHDLQARKSQLEDMLSSAHAF